MTKEKERDIDEWCDPFSGGVIKVVYYTKKVELPMAGRTVAEIKRAASLIFGFDPREIKTVLLTGKFLISANYVIERGDRISCSFMVENDKSQIGKKVSDIFEKIQINPKSLLYKFRLYRNREVEDDVKVTSYSTVAFLK